MGQAQSFNHSIDFRNEHEVGSAIRKSGIPREEIYVTTKVRIDVHVLPQTNVGMELVE